MESGSEIWDWDDQQRTIGKIKTDGRPAIIFTEIANYL